MSPSKFAAGLSAWVLLSGSAQAQSAADAQMSAERVRAHVTFLASDLLQGREAGSAGYDIAANYVASQFAQLGLKPGGANGSYFQPVPLLAARSADEGRVVVRGKDGAEVPLVFGE